VHQTRASYNRVVPGYRDIADELVQRIAAGEPPPGAALPSVRAAARAAGATPATVGRAYAELGRRGIVELAPRRTARVTRDGLVLAQRALAGGRALRLAGSDDPLLDLLAGATDRVGAPGSFGGLSALWQRRADAATLHVRHRDGGYNEPFAARILAGRKPVLVHLWRREQGIIVAPGNPLGIDGVAALAGHVVALRAPGTGTRVLVERLLREAGADPGALRGPAVATHLEGAIAVAGGTADAAVGLRAAAATLGLDFVPLAWEPFELALPEEALGTAADLLTAAAHPPPLPGYDMSDGGTVRRL
jgi:putative molybdopterin biosynthesis protein